MTWRLGGFGPCGCCSCEDCCNGEAPAEFEVEITVDDDYCGACHSAVAGIFVLSRVTDGYGDGYAPCKWQYGGHNLGAFCEPVYGSGGYGTYDPINDGDTGDGYTYLGRPFINDVFLELQIQCIDATHYRVSLLLQVDMWDYPTDPSACNGGNGARVGYTNRFLFVQDFVRVTGECTAYSDQNVSAPTTIDECWCENGAIMNCDTFNGFAPNICDWTSATAKITAL